MELGVGAVGAERVRRVAVRLHAVLVERTREVAGAGGELDGEASVSGKEGEEELRDIMSKVYKIRPFGLEPGNMRELNPSGITFSSFPFSK